MLLSYGILKVKRQTLSFFSVLSKIANNKPFKYLDQYMTMKVAALIEERFLLFSLQ